MTAPAKLTTVLATFVLAAGVFAGCATTAQTTSGGQTSAPTPTAEPVAEATPTPTPDHQTEMPDWAREMHWLIYPDDMECAGTEGCPNDYVSAFGDPGPELPDNVEHYDPEKHDCAVVRPVGVDCFG